MKTYMSAMLIKIEKCICVMKLIKEVLVMSVILIGPEWV